MRIKIKTIFILVFCMNTSVYSQFNIPDFAKRVLGDLTIESKVGELDKFSDDYFLKYAPCKHLENLRQKKAKFMLDNLKKAEFSTTKLLHKSNGLYSKSNSGLAIENYGTDIVNKFAADEFDLKIYNNQITLAEIACRNFQEREIAEGLNKENLGSIGSTNFNYISKNMSMENDAEVKKSNCCDHLMICDMTTLPDSCNQIKNSLLKSENHKDLWSILSRVSLGAQVEDGGVVQGTQNFCNNCYNDVYSSLPENKNKSQEQKNNEFNKIENALKNKLQQKALRKLFTKDMQGHYEHKRLLDQNQDLINISAMAKAARAKTIKVGSFTAVTFEEKFKISKERVTCNDMYNFSGHKVPEGCDRDLALKNMKEILKDFRAMHSGSSSEKKEGGFDKDIDALTSPFSPQVSNILKRISGNSVKLIEAFHDTHLYDKNGNQNKINMDYFKNDIQSRLEANREKLEDLCLRSHADGGGTKEHMRSIYAALLGVDEAPKDKRHLAVENYMHHLSVLKMISPNQGLIFNAPRFFCKEFKLFDSQSTHTANLFNHGDAKYKKHNPLNIMGMTAKRIGFDQDDLKKFREKYGKMKAEDIQKLSDHELALLGRINHTFIDQARVNCGTDNKTKIEKLKLLCGDLSVGDVPHVLDLEDLLGDEKELVPGTNSNHKLVLGKLQCKNNINVINSNGNPRVKMTPEALLASNMSLSELSSKWDGNSKTVSDIGNENDKNENNNKEPNGSYITENNSLLNSDGSVKIGDRIENLMDDPEVKRRVIANNGGMPLESPVFGLMSPERQSNYMENNQISSAENFSTTSSTTETVAQQVFDNYKGTSNTYSDLTPDYVNKQLSNPESYRSLQNKSSIPIPDYSELRDAMKGDDETQKTENLQRYLTSDKPIEDLMREDGLEANAELKKELQALRDTLKNEKKATYDAEMERKLAGANSRIDELNRILRNQQKSGRSPARFEGTTGGADFSGGEGNLPYDELVKSFPRESIGDISSRGQGFVGPRFATSSMGIPVSSKNPDVVRILNDNSIAHQIKLVGDQLILVAGDKSYPLVLKNVKAESGKVVSFEYAGREYTRAQFKEIGFDDLTIIELDKMAKNKQTKNFAEVVEFGLRKEAANSKKPSERFISYSNLKCITLMESEDLKQNDPEFFEKCPK